MQERQLSIKGPRSLCVAEAIDGQMLWGKGRGGSENVDRLAVRRNTHDDEVFETEEKHTPSKINEKFLGSLHQLGQSRQV
jgi:hypothetical protein